MSTVDDVVARLAQHRTLGSAPRHELAWLATHGTTQQVPMGRALRDEPFVSDSMVAVLSGRITITVDRGLGPRKVMEWGPGDITGNLPYSRMTRPPGEPTTEEACDIFRVHRDHFPEMIRECPVVTTTLVHLMLDRVRRFTSSDLQDEKMMSLGKLSAGLAHELNNPASAAARTGKLLAAALIPLEEASRNLGAARLTDEQTALVTRLRGTCASEIPSLSPIDRADREEALTQWLERRGIEPGHANTLVDTALALSDLDNLAAQLDVDTLRLVVTFLAADCAARSMAAELQRAAGRIHTLVAAIKRFTYMDRTMVPEPVALSESLTDSVTLLLHKARRQSVTVSLNIDPSLPRVLAIGGDLNQIWTNLIDNAIDALPGGGEVTVTAVPRPGFIIVSVLDNGPGIPEAIRGRILDPFFTTKPVGQGTGLGLDIARQLIRRNGGDIDAQSRPGRTEFQVTLPVAAPTLK